MSTKTEVLPGENPAGVTHTISLAFLLDGYTKEKVKKVNTKGGQIFHKTLNMFKHTRNSSKSTRPEEDQKDSYFSSILSKRKHTTTMERMV